MWFRLSLLAIALNLASTLANPVAEPGPLSPPGTEPLVTRAPAGFQHPGVLVSKSQLDFVVGKVNSRAQPWANAFTAMMNDPLASMTRQPKPTATVECGPTSTPNIGCTDERQDALAAYAMSLAWYVTKSSQYAEKAISYMNAWANTIKDHTNSNAPLQTGWSGASWARAAEIIRHTYHGWAAKDVAAFEGMLKNVYLPKLLVGSQNNGNWELVMMEAALGISVFLEDKTSYDAAMTKALSRIPAYVYLISDGPYPKAADGSGLTTKDQIIKFWQGQSTYPESGISQETCRDFVHTGYGIASISHIAETSRIQGNDLYKTDVGTRLRYALGFHTRYELGTPIPSWLCNGTVKLGLGPVTEVGFNAMSFRLKNTMTNTETYTVKQRPATTNNLFLGWETLTHAEQPN